MTVESDMAAVEQLRRLEQAMGKLIEEVGGLQRRLTSIEALFGALNRDFLDQSKRLQSLEARLERIEQRLELDLSSKAAGTIDASTAPTPALCLEPKEQKGGQTW